MTFRDAVRTAAKDDEAVKKIFQLCDEMREYMIICGSRVNQVRRCTFEKIEYSS